MKQVIESNAPQDTLEAGRRLGELAEAGEVFCLTGDLGVGKTVFTKGFAIGLGINEPVSSPTFTIVQEYTEGRIPLYHFDVYRIGDPQEMEDIGFDEYLYGEGVCFIEWGERIIELLPDNCTTIEIIKDLKKGLDYRRIVIASGHDR